jgi:hypothetical protein
MNPWIAWPARAGSFSYGNALDGAAALAFVMRAILQENRIPLFLIAL